MSNFTDTNASAIKFIILDPSRKVISEEIRNISLSAGQSTSIPFSFDIHPGSPLGIYHIDSLLSNLAFLKAVIGTAKSTLKTRFQTQKHETGINEGF